MGNCYFGKQSRLLRAKPRIHRTAFFALLGCCSLAFTAAAQVTNYDFNVQVSNIYSVSIQQNGKILVAGPRTGLRLNTNGTVDPSFAPTNPGVFYSLAVQEDGKILGGGSFKLMNGQPHTNIVRFNADGSLDPTFNTQVIGTGLLQPGDVFCLAFEPGGKKLLGGSTFRLPGQSSQGMARLDALDSPDSAFNPGPNGTSFGLAVQADGKILASGDFNSLGGTASGSVARLNPNGTPDPGFSMAGINYANCMALLADGKILVGATATNNGVIISNLVRLNVDGSLDTNFNTHANTSLMYALAVQCDGKVLVGGRFTTLGGQPRKGLGRVNPDGTVDNSFVPLDYDLVAALGLDADGKILVGGKLAGQSTWYVGRLQNTEPAIQNLAWDGSAITWTRGGTAPEIGWASFQVSTNSTDWTELGVGQRIPGGWRLVPTNQTIQSGSVIRAGGPVSVGQYNGTTWFVQSYLPITSSLAIVTHDGSAGFSSQGFGFNFTAPANSSVIIESSTDLLNWIATATNSVNSSSRYFNDSSSASGNRFYRLRQGP